MKFILILLSFLILLQSAFSTTSFDNAFDYKELQQKGYKTDSIHERQVEQFQTQIQKTKTHSRVVLLRLHNYILKSRLKFQSNEQFLNIIKAVLNEKRSPHILNTPPPSLV